MNKSAVEGAFNRLGQVTIVANNNPNASAKYNYQATTLSGVYRIWDYDSPFNLFARLNASFLQIMKADQQEDEDSIRDVSVNLGIGASYRLSSQLQIRADYENFTRDIQVLSLGVEWSPSFSGSSQLAPWRPSLTEISNKMRDSDNDGFLDADDDCPNTPLNAFVDQYGCALDFDNDGVADNLDHCLKTPPGVQVDEYGCQGLDDDQDGVINSQDRCPQTARDVDVNEQGCSSIRDVTFQLATQRIQFAPNSSQLPGDALVDMNRVARYLNNNLDTQLLIEAHTDNTGNTKANQKLSLARANAIRDYLISMGVSAARVEAKGYGASRPIADNATRAGRAQNRRVEFKLIKIRSPW